MILVVLGLEGFLYQTVCSTYVRLLIHSNNGVKIVALLVLLTYTATVAFAHFQFTVTPHVRGMPSTHPDGVIMACSVPS